MSNSKQLDFAIESLNEMRLTEEEIDGLISHLVRNKTVSLNGMEELVFKMVVEQNLKELVMNEALMNAFVLYFETRKHYEKERKERVAALSETLKKKIIELQQKKKK